MTDRGRMNVMLMATLRFGGVTYRARVRDISPGGVKLSVPCCPRPFEEVEVVLPNVGTIRGRVAWTGPGLCGIAFSTQVNPAAVKQAITGSYRPLVAPAPEPLRRCVA